MACSSSNLNYSLSYGVLQKILNGESPKNAFLQILGYKRIIVGSNTYYKLLLNDGINLSAYAILDNRLNSTITKKELEKYTIFCLKDYVLNNLPLLKWVIICKDIEIYVSGSTINQQISLKNSSLNYNQANLKKGDSISMCLTNTNQEALLEPFTTTSGIGEKLEVARNNLNLKINRIDQNVEVVRNKQNLEIIQINISISMPLTNINQDTLTTTSDIDQKLKLARIAEYLEVNSNDKNVEVGRKNKSLEVLKKNASITTSLINTNQNAFTTTSDSDQNVKVVSIDVNFEKTRNDPCMEIAKNDQNLEVRRNDETIEISKNYQHLEIYRADQHRDIVINDQNLEEVTNNKNMKRVKYDQNLEVTRNNQNMKRAKTDQNLVVATNDQNMELVKNDQNLELDRNYQNMEIAKDYQNLEVARSDQNMEIATNDQNLEIARNDQTMELAANDQNLEEIKNHQNIEITTADLNVEEAKNDQNLEVAINVQNLEAYIIDQNQSKENNLLNSIKSLHPRLTEWMIRARVIYKTPFFSYGEGQGKYFSFWLIDDSGEIQAIAFDKNAERIFNLLKENNVYLISNAYVQSRKYNCPAKQEFELIIHKSAKIKPNVGDESTVPLLTFNFKSIFCIKSLPQNSFTDVIGICDNISDTRTLSTKVKENSTVKNFILRDNSSETITVTLWNEVAKNFNYTGDHVVVIRNARVTDYKGCALTVAAVSMIFVDPKIPEATELRSWFHNIDPLFSEE